MNADVLIKKWETERIKISSETPSTKLKFSLTTDFISDLKELKEQQAERNELKERQSGGWDDAIKKYTDKISFELGEVRYVIIPLLNWLKENYHYRP